jgi:hypothetical protein
MLCAREKVGRDVDQHFGFAGARGRTRGVTLNPGSIMPAPASLDDTAPVPSRNPQTDDDYMEGGQKLLDRALRLYPDAGGPIEAFIRLCDNPDWVLRSSTTRTYMARMIKRIEIEVPNEQYEPEHAIAGVTKIYELLEQRRGAPRRGPHDSSAWR